MACLEKLNLVFVCVVKVMSERQASCHMNMFNIPSYLQWCY